MVIVSSCISALLSLSLLDDEQPDNINVQVNNIVNVVRNILLFTLVYGFLSKLDLDSKNIEFP